MFAAAPVKAPVSLASFYFCARSVQTRPIDEPSSSETVNPRVSVVQYVQRREVKKERAHGTWHLSSTCWEPRLCKGPLCQVGIAVATPCEGGRKWELLESGSFIATVFLFLLERQLFLALVSVFVFGGKGFESGV